MHLGSEEQTMTSFTNRRASLVITGLGVLTFLSAPLIPAMAGVVGGARVTNETIYARGSDVYHFTFRGGVPARVVAHADGEDIDMYVYDEGATSSRRIPCLTILPSVPGHRVGRGRSLSRSRTARTPTSATQFAPTNAPGLFLCWSGRNDRISARLMVSQATRGHVLAQSAGYSVGYHALRRVSSGIATNVRSAMLSPC